jgi:hypothetical protein
MAIRGAQGDIMGVYAPLQKPDFARRRLQKTLDPSQGRVNPACQLLHLTQAHSRLTKHTLLFQNVKEGARGVHDSAHPRRDSGMQLILSTMD